LALLLLVVLGIGVLPDSAEDTPQTLGAPTGLACADQAGWKDPVSADGTGCDGWAGYDCATEYEGYSPAADVLAACRQTCGLCPTNVKTAGESVFSNPFSGSPCVQKGSVGQCGQCQSSDQCRSGSFCCPHMKKCVPSSSTGCVVHDNDQRAGETCN
jgi:hypothetical protein